MSTLTTRFEQMVEEQKIIRDKFRTEATKLFHDSFKEFFEKNPGITAVRWTQYTPYFNDGDTCVFGVGEVTYTNATGEELTNVTAYGDYDGEDENVWAASNIKHIMDSDREWYAETRNKIMTSGGVDVDSCKALDKIINSDYMEDVLEVMFDDHVMVTATRDGFDVEEYEHD